MVDSVYLQSGRLGKDEFVIWLIVKQSKQADSKET